MVCPSCIAIWGVIGTAVYFIYNKLFGSCCKKPEIMEKNWKKDTVYLYQFPRPTFLPNHSPFCLKLEAFCRLHEIPLEIRYVTRQSSKHGLLPFVELNGEQIADSQLIQIHLQKHFAIQELTEYEEALGRAVERMVENHTCFVMLKNKYIDHGENIELVMSEMELPAFLQNFKALIVKLFQWKVNKRIRTVLGGDFSDADLRMLLIKDLRAIQGLLGDKKFILGDKATSSDCTVFGHIATLYYLPTSNVVKDVIGSDFPILAAYMERVKETVFGAHFEKN